MRVLSLMSGMRTGSAPARSAGGPTDGVAIPCHAGGLLGLAGIGVGGLAAGRLAVAGRGLLEAPRPPRPGGEIWSSGAGGGAFYDFAAAAGVVCFAASAGSGTAAPCRRYAPATARPSGVPPPAAGPRTPPRSPAAWSASAVTTAGCTRCGWPTARSLELGAGCGPVTDPVTGDGTAYSAVTTVGCRAAGGRRLAAAWSSAAGRGPEINPVAARGVVYFGGSDCGCTRCERPTAR